LATNSTSAKDLTISGQEVITAEVQVMFLKSKSRDIFRNSKAKMSLNTIFMAVQLS
jgi:hypothetical protein